MSWWASLADRIFNRETCEKLIKYQDKSFEFKGVGVEIPGFKLSFEGFSTEPRVLQEATEAAKTLDDLQYQLCQDLSKRSVTELLDRDVLTRYTKARMSSLFLFSSFRTALVAFEHDREGQRVNLQKSIEDIQKFTSSMAIEDLAAPEGLPPRGRDAITSALQAAEVNEEDLDQVLLNRFTEFEKTQREILEKVQQVQDAFDTQVTELKLAGASVELFTSETEFAKGETDCWALGHFRDGDIKSGFDARRPITDKIIDSLENNVGTIIYGKPHYGKTMILKRVMCEMIDKEKGYSVIYCRKEVETNASSILRLLDKISTSSTKLLVIVDDAHRKGSEEVFVAFNNLRIPNVRFLFAAAEAELKGMIENLTSRDEANEVKDAVRKLEKNKISLDFDINDAILFVEKALAIAKTQEVDNISKEGVKRMAEHWYYKVSKYDPFIFVYALMRYIAKDEVASEDFIESEMDEKMNSLTEQQDRRAALLCSFMGAFGIRISSEFVQHCGFYEDSLMSLLGKSILFKNSEYEVRHELWAREFLVHIYNKKCNNNYSTFDNNYRIGDIIGCLLNNASINDLFNILNRTTDWYNEQRLKPIGKVIVDNFAVPEGLTSRSDKADLYCFSLGNFYFSIQDYLNAIKYYHQAIELNPKYVNAWYNKGTALAILERYEEALEAFDKVIELEPNHINAWNNKGAALNDLGKHEDAIKYFDKVIELSNDLEPFAFSLDTDSDSELKPSLDFKVQQNPEQSNAWYNKGRALSHLGRYEDEVACYDKAIALNPRNVRAWYRRAIFKVKKEDIGNGLADLKRAFEIDNRYIELARKERDFESIRNDERFKALVG